MARKKSKAAEAAAQAAESTPRKKAAPKRAAKKAAPKKASARKTAANKSGEDAGSKRKVRSTLPAWTPPPPAAPEVLERVEAETQHQQRPSCSGIASRPPPALGLRAALVAGSHPEMGDAG